MISIPSNHDLVPVFCIPGSLLVHLGLASLVVLLLKRRLMFYGVLSL